MAAMMVSIDKAGRIVIPKSVRDRLDLVAGTQLDLVVEDHGIRIERSAGDRRSLDWEDGRPIFRSLPGRSLTDADVQRVRDAGQR